MLCTKEDLRKILRTFTPLLRAFAAIFYAVVFASRRTNKFA